MYKLDCERPGRGRSSSSLGEFNARAREVELEHEVKRLKQVGPGASVPQGKAAMAVRWAGRAGPQAREPGGLVAPRSSSNSLVLGLAFRLPAW